MEMSADMASKIIDRILPETKERQSRPLNPVYPFVFMDGRILSRAACIPGIATNDYKDILSITAGANETSKFWPGMLNDLKKFSSDFKSDNAPGKATALSELLLTCPGLQKRRTRK